MLEQRAANLFLVVCDRSEQAADSVRRAYGTVESGAFRRKSLLAAAEVHFGASRPLVGKSFSKIIEIVGEASKRRDDIAHGIVHHVKVGDSDEGPYLFPPYYNTARTTLITEGDGSQRYWVADFRFTSLIILNYEKQFGELKRLIADRCIPLTQRQPNGKIPFVEAVTGKTEP